MGENSLTKESLTFGSSGKTDFNIDYYTNKSGTESGGETFYFKYGEDMWKEKSSRLSFSCSTGRIEIHWRRWWDYCDRPSS